jgi:hypothetical protein
MSRLSYSTFYLFLISSAFGLANAQTILTCNAISVPPIVHTEGITERIGDIVLNCSGGTPSAQITGNLSIFLSVNVTNRVAGNTVTDVVFTMDNGSGPQPVNVPGTITGPSALVYNGVSFTLSPTGTAVLRIANIRAAADQLTPLDNNSIQAFLGFNSSSLISLTNTQVAVAKPQPGLFGSFSSKIICGPNGSPLPDNPASFKNLLASNAVFASTRVTEERLAGLERRHGNADHGPLFRLPGWCAALCPQCSRWFRRHPADCRRRFRPASFGRTVRARRQRVALAGTSAGRRRKWCRWNGRLHARCSRIAHCRF